MQPTPPAAEVSPKAANSNDPQPESAAAEAAEAGIAFLPVSLGIVIFGFVLDHATKWWAIEALRPVSLPIPVVEVIPGLLRFVYAENTGAAFSLFSDSTLALAFVSLAASVMLCWFWYTLPKVELWGRLAVAMVLSGALGNMVDRFFRGFVVDFIDAHFRGSHWPTFNIADSFICVGVAILCFRFLRGKI